MLLDITPNETRVAKLIVGRFKKDLKLIGTDGDSVRVKFGYNRTLVDEVKVMEGARWNPDKKEWTISKSQHNDFQLRFLAGENVYKPYDAPVPKIETTRPLREHQFEMAGFMVSRPGCIIAGEMGTGKTLSWITATEHMCAHYEIQPDEDNIWYVGPVAGVRAVGRELNKWGAEFTPRMMTYEKFTKIMNKWDGKLPPALVCFDESSKLKNRTAQRSRAAKHLADHMRLEVPDFRIWEMTGTPAPKSPVNWFWQCQIAQPGYLREGKENKFRERLCLMEKRESLTGGVYFQVNTWWDDENKCANCGEARNHTNHGPTGSQAFKESRNEVGYLYNRMAGLVLVKFKKDCIDLPEKQYEEIRLKPSPELLRASKLIRARATRAVTALTLLRELSDGFQYSEKVVGEEECPNCLGDGTFRTYVPKAGKEHDPDNPQPTLNVSPDDFEIETIECPNCGGKGTVPKYERDMDMTETPKDEYFINDLEEHEEVGRYIVFGGFTGTLDRLVAIAHTHGWTTLRVDGKGYKGQGPDKEPIDADELLDAMDASHPRYDELKTKYPRLCFIGHPKAAGMALTLTAAPTTLYYSNDFDGEARMQSEDRFHRLGMDANKGAVIKDLILLPTDKLVLDNLKQKKRLQNLTLGQLNDVFTNEG